MRSKVSINPTLIKHFLKVTVTDLSLVASVVLDKAQALQESCLTEEDTG